MSAETGGERKVQGKRPGVYVQGEMSYTHGFVYNMRYNKSTTNRKSTANPQVVQRHSIENRRLAKNPQRLDMYSVVLIRKQDVELLYKRWSAVVNRTRFIFACLSQHDSL